MTSLEQAQWIWLPQQSGTVPEENLYALFRSAFTLNDLAQPVILRISAAGNYAFYLQETLAAFGQYTDYPEKKTYSETDVTDKCVKGENRFVCQVHFSGNSFSSHVDGTPGLIAQIVQGERILSSSGESWEAAWDSRYEMGEREKVSSSLNYTFAFHASRQAGPWQQAALAPRACTLRKRPAPPPLMRELLPAKPIACGELYRDNQALPIGRRFAADEADPEGGKANGFYMVFDLGREATGLLTLDLTAKTEMTLDIAQDEVLPESGHLPDFYGARHFTDRYTTKCGRQTFLHTSRRFGCRYLEIHGIGNKNDLTLHQFGLREVMQPGMETPEYHFSDTFFE